MITTEYIHKFIQLNIEKYVPAGIHPLYHIDARKEVMDMVLKLIKNKQMPVKLSYIKLVIMDYKEILDAKFSLLN